MIRRFVGDPRRDAITTLRLDAERAMSLVVARIRDDLEHGASVRPEDLDELDVAARRLRALAYVEQQILVALEREAGLLTRRSP